MPAIREELYLADKFSGTFKSFDAAANASIDTARAFQDALNDFTSGFMDGLEQSLNASRDELSDMVSETQKAASEQDKLANSANETGDAIKGNEAAQKRFTSEVNRSESASNNLLSAVKKIATAVGVMKLAKDFVDTADEMAQITAKLNLINDGFMTTNQLQSAIYNSAQRTRSSYQDTAQLVARIGMNTGNTFKSNIEIVRFAENLNKSFKIAGASSQEQSSVILQLSQALAGGLLRGQEFNAVMSGAPNIIKNIADYMGVTVGEMRDLAAEGQITSDIIREAMLGATDEINAQFNTLPQTFGDVMATAKNKITMSLNGAFEEWITNLNGGDVQSAIDRVTSAVEKFASVGASALDGVATALLWVIENFEAIEPVLIAAGAAVLTYKALHITAAEEVATKWAAVNTTISGIAVAVGALGFVATTVQQSIDKSEPVKAARESGLVESVGGYKGALEASLWLDDLTGGLLSDAGKEFAASAFDLTHDYGGRGFNGTRRRAPGETPTESAARESATAAWYNSYYGSRYTPNDEGFAALVKASRDQDALYRMYIDEVNESRREEERRAKLLEEIKNDGVKVKGEVKLSDEDLKIFRDISEGRYMTKVNLETLAPNVSVTVEGGSALTAEEIADAVAAMLVEQRAERTAIAH